MTQNVGLWIDHRKALLVFVSDSGAELKRIESNVEKSTRSASGTRSKSADGPHDLAADNALDRKLQQHLNVFYRDVIESLGDAEKVLILGPGEAKGELKKQIRSKELLARVVGVETADKMTDPQLIAKVRQYFHPEAAVR